MTSYVTRALVSVVLLFLSTYAVAQLNPDSTNNKLLFLKNRTLCNNMYVIESNKLPVNDVSEYSIVSCKRNLVVYILATRNTSSTITLFDGNFDATSSINVVLNEPIVLRGPLLSVRISTSSNVSSEFRIVISDSFVDDGGNLCGGVVNFDLEQTEKMNKSINYPCVIAVYGTYDHLTLSMGSVEIFGGFESEDNSRRLNITSNLQDPTNLHLQRAHHTISIKPLQGYSGSVVVEKSNGTQLIYVGDQYVNHYLYSSSLFDDNNGQMEGLWNAELRMSAFQVFEKSKLFLELLSPLYGTDLFCLSTKSRCYDRLDGVIQTELPYIYGTQMNYTYDRNLANSIFFARLYATNSTTYSSISPDTRSTTTTSGTSLSTSTISAINVTESSTSTLRNSESTESATTSKGSSAAQCTLITTISVLGLSILNDC